MAEELTNLETHVSMAESRSPSHGVAIVGAGVIGLTTGVLLARRGIRTTLYAKEIEGTASHAACAMWLPFLMGGGSPEGPETEELNESRRWAEISWSHFARLEREGCGVRRTTWYELWDSEPRRPYYASVVDSFADGPFDQGSEGGVTFAWTFGTFIIEMPLYMQWLQAEYVRLGGDIVVRSVSSLDEVEQPVVFNCSGLGSRELASDAGLTPIGGQLIRMPPLDLDGALGFGEYCIVPRSDGLIVGSLFLDVPEGALRPTDESLEHGKHRLREFLSAWTSEPLGEKIGLKGMEDESELETLVGVRPYRAVGARVERAEFLREGRHDRKGRQAAYHDYGHGGSGVTFSWGCAQSSIEDYLWHVRRSLHLTNPDRPADVCDVSIEVGHVEVSAFEDLHKVDSAIEESMRAARDVIRALVENSMSYNLCVLIDDKKFPAAARSSLTRELGSRLDGLGIDFVCMESHLEQVVRSLPRKMPQDDRRAIERRLESPRLLLCSQDIFLWYCLRLGMVSMDFSTVVSAVSLGARRGVRPFYADRLVSVLSKTFAGNEEEADRLLARGFGPEVTSACGRIYY